MTDQRELDRLLVAFFADGTDQVADRVIDAALDQIDHTRQRPALRMPRRFQTMPMLTRLAAAALIGVLAIGGALFVFKPGQAPVVGAPSPTASAGQSAGTSTPTPTQQPTPTPPATPTPTPDIPRLTGPLGDGRQIHTATVLADGRVLVVGGFGNKDQPLASAVVYDPAKDTFSPTGSLATPRGFHTATLLVDGRVLIAGGGPAAWVNDDPYLASAELYDPRTGKFSPTGSMTTARENHTATLLADGRVLIAGGNYTGDFATDSAEIYDPRTGTFTATGSMHTARGYHTATLLTDGRVLVTGGDPNNNAFNYLINSAEIYDPKTGTFSFTGTMATVRAFHAATLLADGRVLITGGSDGANDLSEAEIWDPKTGTFDLTGSMTDGRSYQTGILLANGRVLIAAGGGDYSNLSFLASAEIFDPKTGIFTATGSIAEARTWYAAVSLADGRVLVTGGYGAQAPLASAEIFDPKTGTWSGAGAGH